MYLKKENETVAIRKDLILLFQFWFNFNDRFQIKLQQKWMWRSNFGLYCCWIVLRAQTPQIISHMSICPTNLHIFFSNNNIALRLFWNQPKFSFVLVACAFISSFIYGNSTKFNNNYITCDWKYYLHQTVVFCWKCFLFCCCCCKASI